MIACKIAIGGFAGEQALALLLLIEVADRALVPVRVVRREGLGAGGLVTEAAEGAIGADAHALQSRIISANAIQEIRIAAKAVAVLADHVLQLLLLVVVLLPLVVVVI